MGQLKFLKYSFLFLIIFVSLDYSSSEICEKGTYPPSKDRTVENEYELNLDLLPHKRWAHIGAAYKNEIKALLTEVKSVLLKISKHAQILIDLVDNKLETLLDRIPHPYNDEIRGYAEASGINLGELFFYNIFYEFFTVCTSVVARNDHGDIYHARNLDFGIFMGWDTKKDKWIISELLRNATFHLKWTKQGKTLFKSVNFAGFIGVLTGVKPQTFAFSLNERFNEDGGFLGLFKWLLGYEKAYWASFITRELMETSNSYDEAKTFLSNKELLAPVYFILSGPHNNQACVITRSRLETLDTWLIGTPGYNRTSQTPGTHKDYSTLLGVGRSSFTNLASSAQRDTKLYFRAKGGSSLRRSFTGSKDDEYFFVLETNYDRWTQPPFYDDRRTTALSCLQQLSAKSVSFASLFDLLSTKPMLNKLTVYTSLMQTSTGRLETYIQDCQDPCPPW